MLNSGYYVFCVHGLKHSHDKEHFCDGCCEKYDQMVFSGSDEVFSGVGEVEGSDGGFN